ncbi:hypothetical protein ACHAP5_001976 [Fusarium lateritium]
MKLSLVAAVLAFSAEAFAACARTGQNCKRGAPDLCECNGDHIMKCNPSFYHRGEPRKFHPSFL